MGYATAALSSTAWQDASNTKAGKVTCRQLHAGTYAELAAIKSSLLATIPGDVSFDQAGALPLVCLTAIQVRQVLVLSSALQQGCQQTCFP